MAKSTDDLLNELLVEMRKGGGGRGSGGYTGPAAPKDDPYKSIAEGSDKFADKLINVSSTVKGAWDKVSDDLKGTQGMWQTLSKSGMSFSGDLFALRNSAVGMRLSQEEMADSFSKFASDGILIGFGTDLTRSAEGFSKASKKFFDENSQATDNLRRMGMSTKDINELMALQGVTMRGVFKDEQERNNILAQNAEKLGMEMDAMAKLTGKSRAEQTEMMKKQQADMQFEAAIRLKTQGMSQEEAMKFEANARKQLQEAQLLGQGQVFKEVFATGQIMSKEAATQAALNREQAQAATNAAKTSADRTLDAKTREEQTNKYMKDLQVAAVNDANNTAKLQMRVLGDNASVVSKTLNETAGAQNTMVRNIEAAAADIAKKAGRDFVTPEDRAKAATAVRDQIRMSQEGQNKAGEQVNQTSKALSALDGRLGDTKNAFNDQIIIPLQKSVAPALNSFGDMLKARGSYTGIGLPENKQNQTYYQQLSGDIKEGKTTDKIQSPTQALGRFSQWTEDFIGWVNNKLPKLEGVQKRSNGSLGATGSLFENFGAGTMVQLHGMESVMRPQDLEKVMQEAHKGMLKATPSTGVLDYASLSSNINTTVSAATSTGLKNAAEVMRSGQASYSDKKDAKTTETKDAKPVSATLPKNNFLLFDPTNAGGLKNKSAEIAATDEVKKKEQEAKAQTNVEEMKKGIFSNPTTPKTEEKKSDAAKPGAVTGKEASLSDVVASLNQLNTKVTQLIDVQKDIGNKQIRATKSNSNDVYAR